MSKVDVKYTAGFFDGEGSVGAYLNGSRTGRTLRVQVTQNVNDRSTVLFQQLLNSFGGSISKQRTLSNKIKFNWQTSGDIAARFLMWIQPELRLRKPQVDAALKWFASRERPKRNKLGQIVRLSPRQRKRDKSIDVLLRKLKKQ